MKTVYIYDPVTKFPVGSYDCQELPIGSGEYITPDASTELPIPPYDPNTQSCIFNGKTWFVAQIVPPPTPPELLANVISAKLAELANARSFANLGEFPYNGKNYSASQTAQNDLVAIANYIGLFSALPPTFPGAWLATDGSVLTVPDVATFKALYSTMVAQGIANFVKLKALTDKVNAITDTSAAGVAAVKAIVW